MPEYLFSVPATLEYTVEADTEEQAHRKLIKEGGVTITYHDLLVERSDYESATCIDEL